MIPCIYIHINHDMSKDEKPRQTMKILKYTSRMAFNRFFLSCFTRWVWVKIGYPRFFWMVNTSH